jgi:hypothetical protein
MFCPSKISFYELRTKVKGSGFAAVATGDSYDTPQIFGMNF